MTDDGPMWVVRGGKDGEADALFLKKGYVAIGWSAVGNLGSLSNTLEAFKQGVAKAYPDDKPGAVPVNAGQLYRFVHTMCVGDLVIYPSKIDHQIHIGKIASAYTYAPMIDSGFPNMHKVQWCASAPHKSFSLGALHEMGSLATLFQVKKYAGEFRSVLDGEKPSIAPAEDETVALVAQDIEETTRDFVLKQLALELKGHPLAYFVGALLEAMGYRTQVAGPGADGGIDIVAHRDELGVDAAIKVQVKSTEGSISNDVVASLYGNVSPQEFALFVTLGSYTKPALTFAKGKHNLRLIDGGGLVDLVLAHYDHLDARSKGILPLKRVWVPMPLDPSEH